MDVTPDLRKLFETLLRAMAAGDIVLLGVLDPSNPKPLGAYVCAVNQLPDGSREFVPLARMIDEPMPSIIDPPKDGSPRSPFGVN